MGTDDLGTVIDTNFSQDFLKVINLAAKYDNTLIFA